MKANKTINKNAQELEKKIKILSEKNKKFNKEFNELAAKMRKAKNFEKTDIQSAIKIYEECRHSVVGNFCPEERLVILYKKTNEKLNEIAMCEILIKKQPQHFIKWKLRLDKLTTK